MAHVEEKYDVVIIGAGHAGCEAALASARLGNNTIVFTVSVDSIALMPCNPNIGGTSKGHLVREIDAMLSTLTVNTIVLFPVSVDSIASSKRNRCSWWRNGKKYR